MGSNCYLGNAHLNLDSFFTWDFPELVDVLIVLMLEVVVEVIVIMEMEEDVEVYKDATVGVVRRSIRWPRLLCSWMIVN